MTGTISTQDHQDLLDLIAMGRFNARIDFDRYAIVFDLAQGGAEADAEIEILRGNGGIYNDRMRRIAILSQSIAGIGPLDLRNLPFRERVDSLKKLQPRIIDFLYNAYEQLRDAQETKLADTLVAAKKSLASQVSAITGGSSE
jgi:hypothetical protein